MVRQDDGNMLGAALAYHDAGLCVLPATRDAEGKRPSVGAVTPYRSRLSTPDEIRGWFGPGARRRGNAMCLVCGAISGNLEVIDFDMEGEMFPPWCEAVREVSPELLGRLVLERSPSGGWHVFYRCEDPVPGSTVLAARPIEADGPDELEHRGKRYKPRLCQRTARWIITPTLIETRAEGGLILCDPSPGYELTQGRLTDLPVITADARDTLLSAARILDERPPVIADAPRPSRPSGVVGVRPGDDFNARGDVRPHLEEAGWRLVRSGANEHWCRPGKRTGTSATLRNDVFYVFTSNAPPFEPGNGYSPFATYTLLCHGGDFTSAARALAREGYGMSQQMIANPYLTATVPQFETGPIAPNMVSIGDLIDRHTGVRPPVVHGLLRRGETMNVIAAPKTGKSWLVLDLAVAIATGRKWLDRFECEQGRVLILDNELHAETSADRVPKVAAARGIGMDHVRERVFVDNLRGRLLDIHLLNEFFKDAKPGAFDVVVLDAFYRFMPPGTSENDNGQMAGLYNELDRIADRLRCSFVLVHHTSKGDQWDKRVTDVGAGAGAQSRATDTHLVLRPHEEEDAVVVEATVRSWPPVTPGCLRWSFPVWNVADDLDPANAKRRSPRKRAEPAAEGWDAGRFVKEFGPAEPVVRDALVAKGRQQGLSKRLATELVKLAVEQGLLRVIDEGRNRPLRYTLPSSAEVACELEVTG